jgi:hypothetical protein
MDSLRDIYDYYFSVTGESYIKTTSLEKPEAFNPRHTWTFPGWDKELLRSKEKMACQKTPVAWSV